MDDNGSKLTIFGERLRELLIEHDMSLRELARRTEIDPSNLSKIERGVIYPPRKRATLEKMTAAFGIEGKSKEQFFDLARQVNEMIPEGLESVKSNKAIPMLLRSIENRKLSYEQTRKLAKLVEEENSWQGRIVE